MMRQTLSWFTPPPVSKSLTTDTVEMTDCRSPHWRGERLRNSLFRLTGVHGKSERDVATIFEHAAAGDDNLNGQKLVRPTLTNLLAQAINCDDGDRAAR
jgi:hypothetical protein